MNRGGFALGIAIYWVIEQIVIFFRVPIILCIIGMIPYYLWIDYWYPTMTKVETSNNLSMVEMIGSSGEHGDRRITYAIANNSKTGYAPNRVTMACVTGSSNGSSFVLMDGVYHGVNEIDQDRSIPPSTIVNMDFDPDHGHGHELRDAYGEFLTNNCIVSAFLTDDENLMKRVKAMIGQ